MIIGTDFINGRDFSIDTTRHQVVEGMSGVGKSTILVNEFIETIRAGGGGLFIDPHGDAADTIASLIPKSRARDFVWFDPDAPFVPPFNPLHFSTPAELELGKESLFTTLKSLAGTAWGDESARIIINAIDAVCEAFEHPTPVHVYRFLADDKFRDKILRKTAHPLLKLFREQYDERLRTSESMSKMSPPINKVSKLLRPSILPIIGQPKSLDFLKLMNENRIMVCRLSKGRLGEEICAILGSLIVSMVSIAALKRERQRKRSNWLVVVDEAHNFVHGGRFSTLLAEGRKYGVSLLCGTQGMYQLPFAKDLLANCPTQIIFNASGEDAKLMATNWGQDCAAEITDLPRYMFKARMFSNNTPVVATVKCDPPVERRGDEANRTKLIKASLQRWGVRRKDVDERIMKFLAS
jgi:hypothetical protein